MKNTHKLYTYVIAKSGYTTTGFKDFLEKGGRFSYTKYTDLTGILKYSDTENVTSMEMMFSQCSNLTSIPQLDTSKVTKMTSIFQQCGRLTTIPQLDTSKVTKMDNMFNQCSNLTSIPKLDTSKVTDMSGMFSFCNDLTSIPQLDTSKVTKMDSTFMYCDNLTSIPKLDVSNVTLMQSIFYGCINLSEIHMTGMKVSFDIHYSTLFTREALVEILNNLATVTRTQTLTMGSTNLAKLTDVDKQIATNKGWTLA